MERAVVEYLANAVWQVPLLVGAVAALLWALGAEVRTRHRVWLAVLLIALLLPLRGMAPETPHEESVIFSSSAVPVPMGAPHGARRTAPAADVDFAVPRVATHKPAHKAGVVLGPVTTRWVVRFYIAISLFAAWRILRAWIAAQALLRRSRSIDLAPRAMAIFAQVANAQNVPLPRLRQSDETVSPVVIGAARPVLLLPAGFDVLKDDEIRAALSHEFAHLARRDYLVNLLCQVFALPLAWHPAIHYVQKRIRDTREMLCDAVAAEEMASPVRYATCLVAFALRALDGHDGALATQGVSMFDNRILEERIAQLTQAPEQPEPATRLARLAGATAGLVVAVAMALLIHITPTWAETAVGPEARPVQLTPPALTAPAAPEAPPGTPATPATPAAPAVGKPRHVVHADDDTKRAIAEEEKERAERKHDQDRFARDEAQRQRDEVQRQRDEAQRQREAAREQADRQREIAQQQRDEAQRQREEAHELAEQQREAQRQVSEQQREAMREAAQQQREAIEEARRGAVEASRAYAGEIKRQVAEALRAGQSVQEVDMEKIKLEIAQATSAVHTPEFKAQMAELQNHIQQLHDNMAELRNQMKALNRQVEKVD